MAQTFGPKVLPQITPMEYINDSPLLPLPFDQLYKMEESLFQRDMMRERMDMEREKFGWEREQFEWAKEKQAWNMELEKLKLFQSLAGSTGTSGSTSTGKSKDKASQSIMHYNKFLQDTDQRYREKTLAAEQEMWSGFQNLDSKSPASYADYFNNARLKMAEVEGDPDVVFARWVSGVIEENSDPDKSKEYDPIYMNDAMEDLRNAETREETAAAIARIQSPDKYAVNYGKAIDERWAGIEDQLLLDPQSLKASLGLGSVYNGFTEEMLVATTDNMLPGYLSTPEGRAHFRNQMILAKRNNKDVNTLRAGLEAQGLSKQEIDETLQPLLEKKAEESVRQTFMSLGAKYLGIHGMHNLSKEALEGIKTWQQTTDPGDTRTLVGGEAINITGATKTDRNFYGDYNPLGVNEKTGETNKEMYTKQRDALEKEIEDLNLQDIQYSKMDQTPDIKQARAEIQKKIEENSGYITVHNDRLDVYQNVRNTAEEEHFRVKGSNYREKVNNAYKLLQENPEPPEVKGSRQGYPIQRLFSDYSKAKALVKQHEKDLRYRIDDMLVKQQETHKIKFTDDHVKVDGKTVKVSNWFRDAIEGHDNWPGIVAESGGTFTSGDNKVKIGAGQPMPEGFTLVGKDIEGIAISKEMYASEDGSVGNRIYVTYTEKELDADGKQVSKPKEVSFIDANNKLISQIKGIPEVEDVVRNSGLNLALRPFYAYKDNPEVSITNIDYAGRNLDYRISRRGGNFEIHAFGTDEEGQPIETTVNLPSNIESVRAYIRFMEDGSKGMNKSGSSPTQTVQDQTITNQTNLEILEGKPELLKNEDGDIINTNGVRINKLNDSALTLIDSVLADTFPNIWSSITSTLRERGGIDTETGKPYEEAFGEDAMKRSDHSRFTYSPAFDVSIEGANGIPLDYFFDISNITTLMEIGMSGYEVLLEGPSGHFGEFEKNFNSKGVFVHPTIGKEIPHIKRLVSKQPHYHFGPRRNKK